MPYNDLIQKQIRFEELVKAIQTVSTKDYKLWPVCLLNVLYAYEMWKDGCDWDYVTEILYDTNPNKDFLIDKLHNTFGYSKE